VPAVFAFFPSLWHAAFVGITLVVALAAVGDALLNKSQSRAVAMWVAIILLVPLLGGLLYFLFGRNRIERRAVALRRDQRLFYRKVGEDEISLETLEREVLGEGGAQFAAQARLVSKLVTQPLVGGNSVDVRDGTEAYPAMLEAIAWAERSISLATYIFDNDRIGQVFAVALGDAVGRGVEVRVLIDGAGARYSRRSIVGDLRSRGVRVERFLPTFSPARLFVMNLRNHRKIMVVDGCTGFTGGMNIRYGNVLLENPKHPVRDVHFRVAGPVVAQLQETFAEDWCFTTGESLDGELWFPPLARAGEQVLRGIRDGPDLDHDKLLLAILGAVGVARESVHIVTPYFLPEPPLISALNLAAMRGVDVQIVIPAENNIRTVGWACDAVLPQVLGLGCRVWKSPTPFDHSKLFIIDGRYSLIGSTNLDPRSLRLNFEFNLESYSDELAGELETLFASRRDASTEVSATGLLSRPLPLRLRDGLARLLVPFL